MKGQQRTLQSQNERRLKDVKFQINNLVSAIANASVKILQIEAALEALREQDAFETAIARRTHQGVGSISIHPATVKQ